MQRGAARKTFVLRRGDETGRERARLDRRPGRRPAPGRRASAAAERAPRIGARAGGGPDGAAPGPARAPGAARAAPPRAAGVGALRLANSAFFTVVVPAVFPIYFARVSRPDRPEARDAALRLATSSSSWPRRCSSPRPGRRWPTTRRIKKKLLAAFMALGRRGHRGDGARPARRRGLLASCCSASANIGAAGSLVFYDSLLPHVARDRTRWTASRRPATRWATWAAASCSPTCCLIEKPAWFGLPAGEGLSRRPGHAARAARLPVGRRLVAAVLDPALPARAPSHRARSSATSARARAPRASPSSAWARPSASCAATAARS